MIRHRISISFDTFINHYKDSTTIRDICMYLFSLYVGKCSWTPLAETPRWSAWCSTGAPRDLFRIAAEALLRLLPFWGSHSLGIWTLRPSCKSEEIPEPPRRNDPCNHLGRRNAALWRWTLQGWEVLTISRSVRSFAMNGLRETPVTPSASLSQLTVGPNSRQSLVAGYGGGPRTPDKTSAYAGPCLRPLRSGDMCSAPPFRFSAGIPPILHTRQAPASYGRITRTFRSPSSWKDLISGE